jgi:hypothetical protein
MSLITSFTFCPKCGCMAETRVTVCASCNFSHPDVSVEVTEPIGETAGDDLEITKPDPVEVPGTAP